MQRVPFLFAVAGPLLGVVGLLAALSGQEAAATAGPCDTSNYSVASNEQRLFDQVNGWRSSTMAMPAMQLSAPANKAAQWFAEQMIAGKTSGHNDQYGRTWVQRLKDCGYDSYWAGGSGEALAGFGSSDPGFGSTPEQALASMTANTPGHQNGVQAPVAWQCGGVGYWTNPNPQVGQLRYAWVVLTVQYGSANCPQAVAGGGSTPTGTPSAASSPTSTPTNTPTPTPPVFRAFTAQLSKDDTH